MYKTKTLSNGLIVVSEYIPYVKSVSLGLFLKVGSRNESDVNNGISHFIEHMLFKGTENRTAKEIAESIDYIGGHINAYTSKEMTCFYTKTLDSHFDIAADILSDMLLNAKLAKNDIEVEKRVILEEINMYEDSPEELVNELITEVCWLDTPLGKPVLGTKKTLGNFSTEMIRDYMAEWYTPSNAVAAVVGNFDYDEMISILEDKFSGWNNHPVNHLESLVGFKNDITLKKRDVEQIHVCVGFDGVSQNDDAMYDLLAINNIFGGGMSSRLFQKIREQKGLAYSIYSYPSFYRDAGLFSIYAGMSPQQTAKVSELINCEISLIKKNKLSSNELQKTKEQLKGNYILGLESTSSRMSAIGRSQLLFGRIRTPDEILDNIDKISHETTANVIDKVLCPDKMSVAAVGNVDTVPDFKSIINFK